MGFNTHASACPLAWHRGLPMDTHRGFSGCLSGRLPMPSWNPAGVIVLVQRNPHRCSSIFQVTNPRHVCGIPTHDLSK